MSDYELTSKRLELERQLAEAKARILETCGGKGETYAKQLCPVQTGNLRNSITHRQEDESTELIGTSVSYAPYVELGHQQTPGRYVAAIGARLVASFVPGKPYLKPALENHIDEYKNVMIDELKKIEK